MSTLVSCLNHQLNAEAEARADVGWWLEFLTQWNSVCIIQKEPVTVDSLCLYTDASGLGFGAVFKHRWFSSPWPKSLCHFHINVQELFAIVAAITTWGSEWRNQQVIFYTDNASIVQVWKTGTCRDRDIMTLIRLCSFSLLNKMLISC